MFEITPRAASAIAEACDAQEISAAGGLRIAPKTAVHDGALRSLVVEFVDRPRSDDVVVRSGGVAVFFADGVEQLVGERVLDAEHDGIPPRFVLRARGPAAGDVV